MFDFDEIFNNTDNVGNDFIADVSNSSDKQVYQVYLNGQWIANCNTFEEAETIANGNAMNGIVNIERN